MSPGLVLEESLAWCTVLAGLGGLLEVVATAVLAVPAAHMAVVEDEDGDEDGHGYGNGYGVGGGDHLVGGLDNGLDGIEAGRPHHQEQVDNNNNNRHHDHHHQDLATTLIVTNPSSTPPAAPETSTTNTTTVTPTVYWTDFKLKVCLAINIVLQVLASLVGFLFATWFGPVAIVGPIFFASQLLSNLILFWWVLGLEAFSKEMQIGTYIIVISVVLLLVTGPTTTTPEADTDTTTTLGFDELIARPVAATWFGLLVSGMFLTGLFLFWVARLGSVQQFQNDYTMKTRFGTLLTARSTAFALNLTTSKALIIPISPEWLTTNIVLKVVSGAIYSLAIILQSTTVPQKTFVPVNASVTIFINALTGLFIWQDALVIQSWTGYVCVFLLLVLGCWLLLGGDTGLAPLQETRPETFRGAQFQMTRRANRDRLVHTLRHIRDFHPNDDHPNLDRIDEDADQVVPLVDFQKDDDKKVEPIVRRNPELQNAWAAVYEKGGACPRYAITTRTQRHRHSKRQMLDAAAAAADSSSPSALPWVQPTTNDGMGKRTTKGTGAHTIHGCQSLQSRNQAQKQPIERQMVGRAAAASMSSLNTGSTDASFSNVTTFKMHFDMETEGNRKGHDNNNTNVVNLVMAPPTAPPDDFKYTKDSCALSWWRPIKLLEEGSISDIHLVRRRSKFVEIKYKEKRNVMDVAKKKMTVKNVFSKREEDNDDPNDATIRVLKSIHKDHVNDDEVLAEMRQEILVMSHLKHPNIVNLIEAFERRRHIYLVMEYCPGGNLSNRNYDEQQSNWVVQKILSALAYMHARGVAHRDIKLENIMLNKDGEIKLIDFGLATKYLGDDYANMTETVGTLYSMAPEVLDERPYDLQCDLWSVGVVAYLLLSKGVQPFWGPMISMPWSIRRKIIMECILKAEYAPMTGPVWQKISPSAIAFVQSLLQRDPRQRPTAAQAYGTRWIQSAIRGRSFSSLPPTAAVLGCAVASPRSSNAELAVDSGKGMEPESTIYDAQQGLSEFRRNAWRIVTAKFDSKQIQLLQEKLEAADSSGDGEVGMGDLMRAISQVSSTSLSESETQTLQNYANACNVHDKFKYIDFIDDLQRGYRRRVLDECALFFDNMDVIGDGQVNVDMLLEALQDETIPLHQDIQAILAEKIQRHEFKVDGDGQIWTSPILKWIERRLTGKDDREIQEIIEA